MSNDEFHRTQAKDWRCPVCKTPKLRGQIMRRRTRRRLKQKDRRTLYVLVG